MNAQTSTFTVTGMTCEHCVASVREEVGALPGVASVEVERAGRPVALEPYLGAGGHLVAFHWR